MVLFHDVNIYLGSKLLTSSTRLEIAGKSQYLCELLKSITVCQGCREPISIIFPPDDESENSILAVFKPVGSVSGQSCYSIVESKTINYNYINY